MKLRAALPFLVLSIAVLLYAADPIGRLVAGGVAVLFVPGYLVWSLMYAELRLPRLAAPAVWLGFSLSLWPILFLWSSTLGLRLVPSVLQFQTAGLSLLAVWVWRRSAAPRSVPLWLWLSWVGVLALVTLTRFWQIRGVPLPLWVDSLHHTLLIRVVGETGRIPTSLQPYLPVDQLVYHWGYHTVVAAWRGVAQLPLASAVLWCGQILNAAIALVMYALGAHLLRSPRAGLVAAAVAGLLSLMPAYYVTWGRYTQLTGLLVLAVLILVSVILAERRDFSWRLVLSTGLLLGGLGLIHYRVLVFYAAWMLPYTILLLLRRPHQFGALMVRFGAAGIVSTVLIAPWVVVMLRRVLLRVASNPELLVGNESYNTIDWKLITFGNHSMLYCLAALGMLVALVRRQWHVFSIMGWIGTLVVLANPGLIGLPTSWFINNHSVIITIFMPVSLLSAYAVEQIVRWLRVAPFELQLVPLGTMLVFIGDQVAQAWQHSAINNLLNVPRTYVTTVFTNPLLIVVAQFLIGAVVFGALGVVVAYLGALALRRIAASAQAATTAALVAVALLGTWQLRHVINPVTALVQPADLAALRWVDQHTPPNARFLVNTTPWLNGSYRGTDAGWWVLPVTGRWVSTPPALYIYGNAQYKQSVEAFNKQVSALKPTDQTGLLRLIRDAQITHIFLGSKHEGSLKPDLFFGDPHFTPVYDSEGVTIFEVRHIP